MEGKYVWLLNVDTALIFYDRCMQKEAIKESERNEIFIQMYQEGLIECLGHTTMSTDEVALELAKFGRVLKVGKK